MAESSEESNWGLRATLNQEYCAQKVVLRM